MLTLSGGDLGGQEYDATGWDIDTEKTISGYIYRRISVNQAIFVGMAP